jgi:hypothetical protein
MKAERHLLPSIPAIVFVGLLAFVMFVFQEPLLNSDGDLARHLRHGEYMLQHHTLIGADPFSFTRAGRPFVPFEYGSQLVFALTHRAAGLAGITVLAALLIASAYALLARYLLRRGVEPFLAVGVVLAAAMLGIGHWLARPHLMTLVAIPVLLELLTPRGRHRVWPFGVLFAIWANVHGGFVYGLVLIGIFGIAAVLEVVRARLNGESGTDRYPQVRFIAMALAVSAGATVLTPLGLTLHRHVISLLGESYILNHTSEFASPNFHLVSAKLFLWVLLLALAAAIWSRRQVSIATTLVTLAAIDFALVFQRNVTFFAFTALPLLAVELDSQWRALPLLSSLRSRFEAASRGASTVLWVIMAAAAAIALAAGHGRLGGRTLIVDDFSPERMPVRAVAAARSAGLSGNLFSDFTYGGYVLYAWPEQKVFIDGGVDFYGGDLMRDYTIIRGMKPGWRELIEQWDLAVMLLRPAAPVAAELVHDGGWSYWYCDAQAVVLVRHGGPADGVPGGTAPRPRDCLPRTQAEETGS